MRRLYKHIQARFCTANDTVLFSQHRHLAKVTLNKPKALNALDLHIVRAIAKKQATWHEPEVKVVWIVGAGGKAFCAGGDVRSLYDAKVIGNAEDQWILDAFFREEYTLDFKLSVMKPTQISVMDGIVMGGGVGISVHAPIKIATEHSLFAMPEARLGFFTDVAGGYFLSRLRSNIGLYLGLTGARLKGRELVASGIANFYVPREKLGALEAEIVAAVNENTKSEEIRAIVAKYSSEEEGKDSELTNEAEIKSLFAGDTLDDVQRNLDNSSSEFATAVKKLLSEQNAISLRVIFEQIKRGRNTDLKENFKSDFRLAQRFLLGNDFFEGVRTVLVDKKSIPTWTYKSHQDVPQGLVESYFKPLPIDKELNI